MVAVIESNRAVRGGEHLGLGPAQGGKTDGLLGLFEPFADPDGDLLAHPAAMITGIHQTATCCQVPTAVTVGVVRVIRSPCVVMRVLDMAMTPDFIGYNPETTSRPVRDTIIEYNE
jgi:hypothetical protein